MGMYYKSVGREVVPCDIFESTFITKQLERWSDGNILVSTVFLGMDHGYPADPTKPVVFETMVFGGPLDGSQGRYATYELAIKGHNEWVNLVKPKYCVWNIIKGAEDRLLT